MASLHKVKQRGKSLFRIAFYDRDGVRKFIWLGDIARRAADTIVKRVEDLNDLAHAGQAPDAELTAWLAKISVRLAAKLAKVGLIAPRGGKAAEAPKLGPFLADYIAGRTDVKSNTKTNLEQAKGFLIEHFGADRELATISPGDADDWRLWILTKLGDNTVRRHCGRAKQFFRAALRKRLITENPFEDMKDTGVRPNKARDYFVTRQEAQAVLDACPDHEWRLIFALARFGGLRTPSELLELKWGDIDWEKGRFTVHSPKTEHHEGKESRIVPIFPELRPHIEEAFHAAQEGAEHVVVRYRDKNSNLRTQLNRIIAKAGLTPWQKLFQNLRASRATELAAEYPAHVAAAWLGHSEAIAAAHYWRVTDADFTKAASARIAPLHTHESATNGRAAEPAHTGEMHGDSQPCAAVNTKSVHWN